MRAKLQSKPCHLLEREALNCIIHKLSVSKWPFIFSPSI